MKFKFETKNRLQRIDFFRCNESLLTIENTYGHMLIDSRSHHILTYERICAHA